MKYLIIILMPLVSYAETIKTGQWDSEAHFKLNSIPLPPKKDSSCVTSDEAKDPKKMIEQSLKRNDCELTKWVLKKGNVNAIVNCKNDQLEATGTITGTFTKKNYALKGEVKGRHSLIGNATAKVTFDGTWVGECVAAK